MDEFYKKKETADSFQSYRNASLWDFREEQNTILGVTVRKITGILHIHIEKMLLCHAIKYAFRWNSIMII